MKNCGLKGKTRKHQNFICVRLAKMLMKSCGLDCGLNRKLIAPEIPLSLLYGIFSFHFMYLENWFSHCRELGPRFSSSLCALRFRQARSFC